MKFIYFKLKSLFYSFTTLYSKFIARIFRVQIGKNFKSNGTMIFWKSARGSISISDNVTFNNSLHSNYVGLYHKSIVAAEGEGRILIGAGSGFSGVVIHSRIEITIGENVFVGGNVKIFDHDFHSHYPDERKDQINHRIPAKKVMIMDNVFIGANSIILKGTSIGKNSIIGAGSVVHGIIPDNQIWAGNPAKFVKEL